VADGTADYIAITRLLHQYGDICVRRAWTEMSRLCAPDACFTYDLKAGPLVRLEGAGQLCAFGKRALERYAFYQYIPLTMAVEFGVDQTATGRLYVLEVGTDQATGQWMEFYGLYHDEYVIADGAWVFARRHYQALAHRTGDRATQVFPLAEGYAPGSDRDR
jgi:hypothetical protein